MVNRIRSDLVLRSACVALPLAIISSCVPRGETPERGAIEVTVTGSDQVINGIPASAFDDGWSVTFDRFLVFIEGFDSGSYGFSSGDASVSFDEGCDFPYEERRPRLLNAQQSWSVLLRAIEPTRCRILFNWHSAYKEEMLGPANMGPGVGQDDIDDLRTRFASIHLGAVARRGAITKRLSATYRFDLLSLGGVYSCLENADAKTEGVVVKSGEKVEARLIVMGEQLFRTQLGVGAGALRFDAWAHADENGDRDGTITYEELSGVQLGFIAPADGTYSDTRYGAKTLGDFIKLQSRFLWQFGEHGICARVPER